MFQRILRMFGATAGTVGTTLLAQLLLPPLFIHFYGISRYGEWLVLSAGIAYLSTLNFGITTYAANELTILRKRGEGERYRELQASTLALLLLMVVLGIGVSVLLLYLPLPRLLHLSIIPAREVALAASLLGLQAMLNILTLYYTGLFMVVEQAHRGCGWDNVRRLSLTLVCVPLAAAHLNFALIAFGQFLMAALILILTVVDLRRRMGGLPLGLHGANWKTAKSSLVPSGMFAMVFAQHLLVFQAPMILLQRLTGADMVVLFSVSRTIFSTARQGIGAVTAAIAPEITFSYGRRDRAKLLEIFHYSEQLVFALIPVANLGVLLLAPLLVRVWLHRPGFFMPGMYAVMALISSAMSTREHKQYFQYSTNQHQMLSLIVFLGNIAMIVLSIPATIRWGLSGFMGVWLISELSQMGLLYRENRKLFHGDRSVSAVPIVKLALGMAFAVPLCVKGLQYATAHSLAAVAGLALLGLCVVSAGAYLLFDLGQLRRLVAVRFRNALGLRLASCDAKRVVS